MKRTILIFSVEMLKECDRTVLLTDIEMNFDCFPVMAEMQNSFWKINLYKSNWTDVKMLDKRLVISYLLHE